MKTSKIWYFPTKDCLIPLIQAFVLLYPLFPFCDCNSSNPYDVSAESIFNTCLNSDANATPSVVCYAPREFLLSCEGIHNHDNCLKIIATYAVSPSSALSVMTQENFAFDVQSRRLCFQPQIERWGSIHTFVGYDLRVYFFEHGNPGAKTEVKLGVIFRSGVGSRAILESTFGCVETPKHIPYIGNSLPVQASSNRTEQEKEYSLDSLRKVSFEDGAYLKDYFNNTMPLFQFKGTTNYSPPGESGKKNQRKKSLAATCAVLGFAFLEILIAYLVYRFLYAPWTTRTRRTNTGTVRYVTRTETINLLERNKETSQNSGAGEASDQSEVTIRLMNPPSDSPLPTH